MVRATWAYRAMPKPDGHTGQCQNPKSFFCNPKWKQFQRPTIPKGTVDTESRSAGKYGGSNRSFTQIAEEECEEFPVALIPMDAWQFTVILHKDDTHKSTWIPLQFHSGLDKLSTKLRPFYGSKEPQLHCTCFLRRLPNVLRAQAACQFLPALPPDGSAPAALPRLPVGSSGSTKHRKTQHFAHFLSFISLTDGGCSTVHIVGNLWKFDF